MALALKLYFSGWLDGWIAGRSDGRTTVIILLFSQAGAWAWAELGKSLDTTVIQQRIPIKLNKFDNIKIQGVFTCNFTSLLSILIGTSGRRSSRSAFGRSTGNDVSGHYKRHYFLFFLFFLFSFLRRELFSKKESSDQKPWGRHLSKPRQPFLGQLAAILDFAGGAALQAVNKCPRRR